MDPLTIVLLVLGILAIVTFVDLNWDLRWAGPTTRRLRSALHGSTRRRRRPCEGGVRIEAGLHGNIWLEASSPDDRPAMSINGYWRVVNMTEESVQLTDVFILHPLVRAEAVLVRCPRTGSLANTPIDAGSISQVVTYFWLHPAVCGPGSDFETTIIFRDQLQTEHIVENVRFRYSSSRHE